ncbi:MAG: hypothetical protein QM783_13350 [Phycisphaerales bacterium]
MRYTLSALSIAAITAAASAQTWNFDAPVFTFGESTPLLDRAANIPGSTPGMTASFDSLFGALAISDSADFQPNSLMQGQYLFAPGDGVNGPLALLTITFSQPVTSASFDFAVNGFEPGWNLILFADPDFGAVDEVPVYSLYAAGEVDTTGFGAWGGHVDFTSATPFTTIVMTAIFGDPTVGTPPQATQFAIDNLTVTPTPGAAAAFGLAGAASLRRRRR